MRVLVIDDDDAVAAGLRRGLQRIGSAVDVASDGTEGLWLATATSDGYDVILLDLMLPGLSGFTVCEVLRERGNWTPILVLTAKDGEWDIAEALDSGADDVLVKPFSLVVLEARLRALVRRGRAERPATFTIDDLVIDPAAHTCRRGGDLIDLTPKEFAVLEHLARHHDRVVSKQQLVQHLWDFAFDGDPNVLEVHVSNLRRKLDRPFGRSNVVTVRGVGYRLAADGQALACG